MVPHIIAHNGSAPSSTTLPGITFIKAGERSHRQPSRRYAQKSLLSPAHDWQVIMDFDSIQLFFPPEITNTHERPDIVLWSISTRSVILIELTCPAEENFNDAKERKLAKYAALCEQIRTNDWKVVLRTVEAGARGFVAKSFFRVFGSLASPLRKRVSLVKISPLSRPPALMVCG